VIEDSGGFAIRVVEALDGRRVAMPFDKFLAGFSNSTDAVDKFFDKPGSGEL
jgi:hypothetical protein